MNIKKFLLLSSVALMAVACQDSKEPNSRPGAKNPDEITFGGEFYKDASSRTVYGDQVNWAFPISWVENDIVFIYSPDVQSGRNQALYRATKSAAAAEAFAKIGEYGIQWGKEESANFYSVYPGKYNDESVVTVSEGLKFNLNMTNFQTCKYAMTKGDDNSFHLDSVDHYGALMYAKTSEKVKNPNDVNLQYHALSTGIRVRLHGPGTAGQSCTISSIKLKAPIPIAGNFTATFSDANGVAMPTVTPCETGTYNEITLYTQYTSGEAFLNLNSGEWVDLNFFLIPTTTEEIVIDERWSIEVILAGYPKLTKTLKSKSDSNTKLKPGMMHRLEDLPAIVLSGEWDIATWMRYIPRNVYLSEISIPGSWESLNPKFQGNPDLTTQYVNGCRAFHINCCYHRTGTSSSNYTYNLGTDNGGQSTEGDEGYNNVYMTGNNPSFKESLTTISQQVKPDEYLVVMCSLRLKAGIPQGKNWMQDIADVCDELGDVIFDANKVVDEETGRKNLSPMTTVGDALGKVIVIVNCEDKPQNINIPSNSKCVFAYAPIDLKSAMFPADGGYNPGNIYYGGKGDSGIKFLNTLGQVTVIDEKPYGTLYRGFAPKLTGSFNGWIDDWSGEGSILRKVDVGSRLKNCQKLLSVSKDTFGKDGYAHDQWYYFGLGGYHKVHLQVEPDLYNQVAKTLNDWMNGMITDMTTSKEFYPVGIVLMNFIQYNEYGSGTYKQVNSKTTGINILKLNNRYHKAYDPKKPAFPTKPVEDETQSTPSSRAAADGWD